MAKKTRSIMPKWQYFGIASLAVVTAATAAFALTDPVAPPPVSPQVASYTPAPVPTHKVEKVAVFGDSYAAGSGASSRDQGWAALLGWNQQWSLTNVARGGTGYVGQELRDAVKAKNMCGLDACPNYAGMIPEAVAAKPTVVLVTGGRNDYLNDGAAEAAAIQSFYTALRAALPEAKIYAFNPLWDSSAPPASLSPMADEVKAAVTSVGGTFIDSGQLLNGKSELIAADAKHPNSQGHRAIFEAYVKLLRADGIAV